MVGVPRSKGCRICVQRRVKCDQTRPTCNNCKKGNRPCPGYSQDLKFQDEGARLRRRFQNVGSPTAGTDSSRDSSDSPPESSNAGSTRPDSGNSSPAYGGHPNGSNAAPLDNEPGRWDAVGLNVHDTQRRTFFGLLEGKSEMYALLGEDMPDYGPSFVASIGNPYSPDSEDRFVFKNFGDAPSNPFYKHVDAPILTQQQMIIKFKQSLYPEDSTIPPYLKNHSRWLSHLPPLTGTNQLLDASVRAVTLVHIGRLNNSEPFVMESRPYYGQALRLLNKTLKDRKQGMQNETLCAVILLSFYEMFASDNNDSWIRHAGGVSALMRARGPTLHRHGLDREIFLAYRYMLIIESFQEDVPCFLAEPEWQNLSRTIHQDLKDAGVSPERVEIFDLAEEFYQVMVVLPGQTCDARALWSARQTGAQPPCNRAQLIDRITASRIEFKSTFARFEAALKKIGHAPTIKLDHANPLLGIQYEFVNTFASATYTGYWTVLIALDLCLQGLQSDDAELVDMYRTESKNCALNICRSSAFMLTSSFLGPFFLIFGLRCSLLVFEDHDGPEADWILRKLFVIGDRHMGIAKHVPGYKPGVTVDELITEYKARKAASKQNNNIVEEVDFARQVAHGDIFQNIDSGAGMESADAGDGTTTSSKVGLHDPRSNWQGLNQIDDVLRTWDDQDNFPISEMNKLDFLGDGDSSGGISRQVSPVPPTGWSRDGVGLFPGGECIYNAGIRIVGPKLG